MLQTHSSNSSVGSIGGYNTTTRQTTGTSAFSPPQSLLQPPDTTPDHGSPRLGTGSSHTLPRQHGRESSNDSNERPFVSAGNPVQRSRTPSAREISSRHQQPGPSPMKASYIPPDRLGDNPSRASTNDGDQYNPGTVRNLVQTYQKNVQHSQYNSGQPSPPSSGYNGNSSQPRGADTGSYHSPPHHQTSPQSGVNYHHPPGGSNTQYHQQSYGSKYHQPAGQPMDPVAPPRRSRPMSAGPLATSNQSAFSAPTPSGDRGYHHRSHTPNAGTSMTLPYGGGGGVGKEHVDRGKSLPPNSLSQSSQHHQSLTRGHSLGSGGTGGAFSSSSGRVLPQRPDERPLTQNVGGQGVGGGPPRPSEGQPPPPSGDNNGPPPSDGEKPKNSKWYEYGCV